MGQCKYLRLLLGFAPVFLVPASADERPIGLVLEQSLAAPDIYQGVEGAKSTILVPGRDTSAGLDTFTKEEWEAEKLEWPEVMAGAMAIADRLVEGLEVDWERDENGVIVYGEAQSEQPFLESVMFSKRFPAKFRGELGTEFFVVVPVRGQMFLFPRYGGKLEDFAGSLTEIYRGSALRVSLEVFLVNEAGCRVVGSLGGGSRN